ncbi:hypothetical protein LR48_Vigan10g217900 [Vigna angularis]|uniref:Protein kinase domain-containing protein n=1 Tax=Phaseolus angularis TaxID=3914 RepID=A0A0L9VN08_PHAAN|nr:hypothetical protein LR48_Vigan10g217900 [Vigna angularis]
MEFEERYSLIDHPNVLQAHCSFTTGHNLWVVMPYMAGGSCLHIMKSAYPEGFEEPVIATLLHEVLKALVYLHAHGHIHRDVKAGNILLDSNGAVKLADFGVSACMFDTGDRQRSRNTFVGTPCWMAPEVLQQLHGYDFKYMVIWYTALELAHGHAPFSKYPPMKVLLMTLQNAPPGLDYERDKRFSKAFKELVATCLVKDPKKRPRDRFRSLKAKEADLLVQNKALYEDKDQLSQKEYIRGISAWNFNLEDLKSQAALIQDDDIPNVDEPQKDKKEKVRSDDFRDSAETLSSVTANHSDDAPTQNKEVVTDGDRDYLQTKYASERNHSGPLQYRQKRDTNNLPLVDDTSDGAFVQRRERFKVTSADLSPMGPSNNASGPVVSPTSPPNQNFMAGAILPSLQCILQQNGLQREEIIKLIKYAEQSSGNASLC